MGAFLENEDRLKLEIYLKKHTKLKMPSLPEGDSIFNYNVDVNTGKWIHWNTGSLFPIPESIAFRHARFPTAVKHSTMLSVRIV